MRILIVGLPLFAERLKNDLQEFDSENSYFFLNTYYNKWHKLKALFLIPFVDVVYSINGTISTSRAFDIAFSKKVPVVMNWVGTDVLKANKKFNAGTYRKDYIENAIHFCEVDWIREELKEIGINAKVVSFIAFEKEFKLKKLESDRLKVLSYIATNRAAFYGIDAFIELANNFPKIDFSIAGFDESNAVNMPTNVKALGWVENMDEVFNENHVCLRFPEHDGLSVFILESLARGKKVMYKYPFDYCNHCPDEKGLHEQMLDIEKEFNRGSRIENPEAIEFIKENYSSAKVFGNIVNELKQITNAK